MGMSIDVVSLHMATLGQAAPKDKVKLLAALRRLGWSQAQLCRRIGRNPSYLARVLSGKVTSATVWRQAWAAVRDAQMSMSMGESNGHASANESEKARDLVDVS